MIFFTSLYRFFCSLRLAVCLLAALIVLFATGTVYESLYGRFMAQEVVYQSLWMLVFIFLLALNITAVMIDRWPWKKKHIGFLSAHFGILFIIAGSLFTRYYGVDGYLKLKIGETRSHILTSQALLAVYSSFSGRDLTELYREPVAFFRHPPSVSKPLSVPLGTAVVKVTGFYPSAVARPYYQALEKKTILSHQSGVALRFQLEGERVHLVSWLFKPGKEKEVRRVLGPAQVILRDSLKKGFTTSNPQPVSSKKNKKGQVLWDRPALLLAPAGDKKLRYELHYPGARVKKISRGILKVGSLLPTGWMDLKFRVLSYLPRALPAEAFSPSPAGENTTSAIQVTFRGEKKWMGLNSHLFFFDKDKVFIVAYVNDRHDLNFNIKLLDFTINRYPSGFKPAGYKSQVQVFAKDKASRPKTSKGDERDKNISTQALSAGFNYKNVKQETPHFISMNNPLKHGGYTIYQSGFEEDDQGRPLASVFAVNRDPGRGLKYFGSILVVLGSLILFIRKKLAYTSRSGMKPIINQ